jgi:hypothetical protein
MTSNTISKVTGDGNVHDEVNNVHPLESFKTQLVKMFEVTCDDDEEPVVSSS